MLCMKSLIKSSIVKLVLLEKWYRKLAQEYQDCVFLCFPAWQFPSFPLSHIIRAPNPQLRRKRNNSVSLPGNMSYCREILGVFSFTMLSTSVLGYLLSHLWKEALPSIQYCMNTLSHAPSTLLHLDAPSFFHFPLFSTWCFSSITYPAAFFLSDLSAPSETN